MTVEDVGGSFADIGEIGDEAVKMLGCAIDRGKAHNIPSSTKAAGKQVSMNPFVPLGVSCCVWLFILGLEDANNLAVWVSRKVTARTALRDHARVYFLPDGGSYTFDNNLELVFGHDTLLRRGNALSANGAYAFRGLEDGVVDLEALLLASHVPPLAFEARGDLIGPAFEAGIDGLEVDTGIAASALAELGPGGE